MPAATTKADLLAITRRDYAKLEKLLASIPEDVALAKDADGISIKDIVGHRAHWIDLYLGWYADGQAGREVHIPAKGYNWAQLKPYNAKVRAEQAGLGWAAAQAMLANNHAALLGHLEALPDEALYGAPMIGSEKWTAGRFAESAGPSHYRSAIRAIRASLKALQASRG
ncbi:ClbS/DfsB family four-helix bundle protein [Pontivivens ytuae]|uniref:ClbS/DfsB family four-helix bundle protein n=1 Tax=Pontivivens ytuae TaxID=2789856 RepID=A0A7S9LV70_9RHOB|nr:ClbS/DfsB family four-helix bundle protein [Pontivivens ytuae]QPH55714.1 ClbS/DfsB family four-helix bundle protein [Pontivivens ytuae]